MSKTYVIILFFCLFGTVWPSPLQSEPAPEQAEHGSSGAAEKRRRETPERGRGRRGHVRRMFTSNGHHYCMTSKQDEARILEVVVCFGTSPKGHRFPPQERRLREEEEERKRLEEERCLISSPGPLGVVVFWETSHLTFLPKLFWWKPSILLM